MYTTDKGDKLGLPVKPEKNHFKVENPSLLVFPETVDVEVTIVDSMESVEMSPVVHTDDEARQPSGTRRPSLGPATLPSSVPGNPSPATNASGNGDSTRGDGEQAVADGSRSTPPRGR